MSNYHLGDHSTHVSRLNYHLQRAREHRTAAEDNAAALAAAHAVDHTALLDEIADHEDHDKDAP